MVFLVVKELRTHCHLAPTRTIDMTKSRVAVIIYCLVRFQCLFFPLWCLAGWKLTQCEKDSSRSLLDSSDICNRRTWLKSQKDANFENSRKSLISKSTRYTKSKQKAHDFWRVNTENRVIWGRFRLTFEGYIQAWRIYPSSCFVHHVHKWYTIYSDLPNKRTGTIVEFWE